MSFILQVSISEAKTAQCSAITSRSAARGAVAAIAMADGPTWRAGCDLRAIHRAYKCERQKG
jgi:hypothetical protein